MNLGQDCLINHDIHVIRRPNSAGNYKQCQDWCNSNDHCGAIVVHSGTCFFKPFNYRGKTCSTTYHPNQDCVALVKLHNGRPSKTIQYNIPYSVIEAQNVPKKLIYLLQEVNVISALY